MFALLLSTLLLLAGGSHHVGAVHTFDVVGGGPGGNACGSGPC